MDLVDLIVEKRFLGQEFLTWLWWKSEERGGSVELPGEGDITVVFEKHMLLESGEGESTEKIVCTGLQTELQEARTGLQMGKKLEQARIVIGHNDYEYSFTLAAALMEFRNVRLPKTETTENDKSDNPEEVEGMILERIYLFEELIKLVNALFRMFLNVRLGSVWREELQKIRHWVAKSPTVAADITQMSNK
jgi:recombination associated protein RdgC